MSNDLNLCCFIGRLGKDPEVRYTAGGDAVASFSIAVGESWKDKETGDKTESVEWVRCVAWRRLAEVVGEYLTKGSQVHVSGKMKTRKWQDRDGNDRYTTEITVNQLQMLGSKKDKDDERPRVEERAPRGKPSRQPAQQEAFDDDPDAQREKEQADPGFNDDDIPF